MATKPDCIYYDWGRTAPREYGAFCEAKMKSLEINTCEKCKIYTPQTSKYCDLIKKLKRQTSDCPNLKKT